MLMSPKKSIEISFVTPRSRDFLFLPTSHFYWLNPLGQVSHSINMSMFVYVPSNCIFFMASHWPTNGNCPWAQLLNHLNGRAYSRVSLKAPLVTMKLLPPIFLFHLVQSLRFFFEKKFNLFFLCRVTNFLTLMVQNLKWCPNIVFDSLN